MARGRRALFAAGVALVIVIGRISSRSSSAIISIVAVGIIGAVFARAARVRHRDQRIIFMASPSVFWNCEWHVMCLFIADIEGVQRTLAKIFVRKHGIQCKYRI
jgi:hypothetical protein